jgi:hypothetical protein
MSVLRFHARPLKDLYSRDDTFPAKILRSQISYRFSSVA